jgi:glucose-6-phosphate isomerase
MSTISAPIDATQTPAWKSLEAKYAKMREGFTLKQAFADDPHRVDTFSFETSDLHFDLSKNLIDEETITLLTDLARAVVS